MAKCWQKIDEPVETNTSFGYPLRAILARTMPTFEEPSSGDSGQDRTTACDSLPLYQPVIGFGQVEAEDQDDRFTQIQSWRATQTDEHVSGKVLGLIVHKALQRWLFPGDPALKRLLESEAYRFGLVTEATRQDVIVQATDLLERFREHPVWQEIDLAQERHSELPYSYVLSDEVENRIVDLLYRDANGWHVIDFKTDPISTFMHKEQLIQAYAPQVRRYKAVVESKLGQVVSGQLCFLDDRGEVSLVKV